MSEDGEALRAKALAVTRRVMQMYGELPLVPRREPLHELISTMLSHRTTEQNEELAFQQMAERFGSWEAIRDAPLDELVETLQPANFAEVKAPRIQAALARIIMERGEPSLDFLADLSVEDGLAWLMKLQGVGVKTASLVLLFCFGKPVLPVDTHVHRVSQRLGLIGPQVSAEAAHTLLLDLLPPDPPVLFNFHKGLLRHGQRVCVWDNPRCHRCHLTELCDWYQANRAGDSSQNG